MRTIFRFLRASRDPNAAPSERQDSPSSLEALTPVKTILYRHGRSARMALRNVRGTLVHGVFPVVLKAETQEVVRRVRVVIDELRQLRRDAVQHLTLYRL